MEPLTIVIGIASIVATGALSRVGESISNEIASNAMQLLSKIKEKSPRTASAITAAEQQPVDYAQAYQDIQAEARNDEDLNKLFKNMELLAKADSRILEIVRQELDGANPQLTKIIENWKGINIKGGTTTITGNTFQF